MDDLWTMKSEDVGLIVRAIVSKIFNLCGHDPPTSQTDRWTTCDRKTVLCTIVHHAVKTILSCYWLDLSLVTACPAPAAGECSARVGVRRRRGLSLNYFGHLLLT